MLSALFFLLLIFQATCAAGQVNVHVASLNVVAIGWPQTTAELSPLSTAVTSVVCAPLADSSSADKEVPCGGFLEPVGIDMLSVQMYAETASLKDSFVVRLAFGSWVSENATVMLKELTDAVSSAAGKPLSLLSKISGVYTLPCRSKDISYILPRCSSTNNAATSLLVDDLEGSVNTVLCDHVPSPCSSYISTTSISPQRVMVNIRNLPNTLELALMFSQRVRTSVVKASKVLLYSSGEEAQLYSVDENELFEEPIKPIPQCDVETALWMLAFIAIIPILFFLFCYLWCRSRHHAKKRARKAIVEDELRVQSMEESPDEAFQRNEMQHFVMQNNVNPQEQTTNPRHRRHRGEQKHHEGYNQSTVLDTYVYPPQEALNQQQEEGQYDDYDQTGYDGEQYAATADEYVEPNVAADGDNEDAFTGENQNDEDQVASS